MSDEKITCGMCGHEFGEEDSRLACGRCSLFGSGGCRQVRCPRCGYEMPPPARLTKWIGKLMGGKKVGGEK